MYYVYILRCSNGSYYTGCTGNLKERFESHQQGQVISTRDKLPVTLVNYIAFKEKSKAFKFEKYLKSGSGIAFRNRHFL